MDDRLGEQKLVEQIDQGNDEEASNTKHPQRHRAAAERDAHPIKLRLLPVQGCSIDELGGGDLCRQRGRQNALRKESHGYRGDPHARVAARTSVLGPDVLENSDLSRNDLQLLAGLLADALKRRTCLLYTS